MKPGVVSKALVPDLWEVDKRQIPQNVAGYDPYGAKGSKGCATCQWFISPNTCLLVAGDISPGGLSNYYAPIVEYQTPPLLVKIVEDSLESSEKGIDVLGTIKEWWKSIKGEDETPSIRPFTLYKDSAGNLRYFLIYSNNFIDKHKEILSEEAHKEYVEWVDETGSYPELQLWHCGPKSAIGRDDFVDYVDGFAICSGTIYPDKVEIAQAAAKQDIGVSHGFVGLRPEANSKWYRAYRTFERSILPRKEEANVWTSYAFNSKEAKDEAIMPISDKKKAWFKSIGVPDSAVAEFESGIKDVNAALKTLGIEYKEETPATVSNVVANGSSGKNDLEGHVVGDGGTVPANNSAKESSTPADLTGVVTILAKGLDATNGNIEKLAESLKALMVQVNAIAQPIQKQAEEIAASTFEAAVTSGLKNAQLASQSPNNLVSPQEKAQSDKNAWMGGGFAGMIEKQVGGALGIPTSGVS